MASPRYTLNIKPEDLQPEQPKHEMTGKEKRENFWFYHKWHVIVGIVAAVLLTAGGGVFLFLYLKKRKKNA